MKSDYKNFPETAIMANGKFPDHPHPLAFLLNAQRVVCCDGAADSLIDFGLVPYAIVGDCDSVNKKIIEKYNDRIFRDSDQESNDLTKSVKWCANNGFKDLVILGATGKREDHTLGNISLLTEYAGFVNVKMVTDAGIFFSVQESCEIESEKGQQVSVFSIDPNIEITSSGLKYRLEKRKLANWWNATLNEAEGRSFSLQFKGASLIVFMKFPDYV